jgi:hypothetical protein
MGINVLLRSKNPEPPMSALGQKRTWRIQFAMSALPPKADIADCIIADLDVAHELQRTASLLQINVRTGPDHRHLPEMLNQEAGEDRPTGGIPERPKV